MVATHHGRRRAAAVALRRIAGFFRILMQSAERLTAEDRRRRILAEALEKSSMAASRAVNPGCRPLRPREGAEIDPEIDRPDRAERPLAPSNRRI